jgi:hypothetical protein
MFKTFWTTSPANKLQIRSGNIIYGTYSLNQHRILQVSGALGTSTIEIKQGKARFKHSPCANQYCVHQGWMNKANQTAICLPNQVSLELLGEKQFDTLNY